MKMKSEDYKNIKTFIDKTTSKDCWKMLDAWRKREDNILSRFIINKHCTLGMTNEIVDLKTKKTKGWVIFLDYDKISLNKITKKVKQLQNKWDLGNAYIFKTGINKWHVWLLDIFRKKTQVWKILEESGCDKKYLKMSKRRGHSNIRIWKKNGKDIHYHMTIFREGLRKTAGTHWYCITERHIKILYDNLIRPGMDLSKLREWERNKTIMDYLPRPVIYAMGRNLS